MISPSPFELPANMVGLIGRLVLVWGEIERSLFDWIMLSRSISEVDRFKRFWPLQVSASRKITQWCEVAAIVSGLLKADFNFKTAESELVRLNKIRNRIVHASHETRLSTSVIRAVSIEFDEPIGTFVVRDYYYTGSDLKTTIAEMNSIRNIVTAHYEDIYLLAACQRAISSKELQPSWPDVLFPPPKPLRA